MEQQAKELGEMWFQTLGRDRALEESGRWLDRLESELKQSEAVGGSEAPSTVRLHENVLRHRLARLYLLGVWDGRTLQR